MSATALQTAPTVTRPSLASLASFADVTKDYPSGLFGTQKLPALRGVSFDVKAGEVFGLLGPNRAGKTTLIKILLSLCRPSAGTVMRLGRPLADLGTLGRVGYMHENHAFPRYLTAAELLEYYGALTLLPYDEVRRRVPALLERVGLADRSREPIARFSKGMVQRLGLAQAILNQPDLLVLDEPAEGLDLDGRQLLRDVVQDQREQGRTVLMVSHALSEVERLCDRVAVLVQGRLAYLGAVAELCPNRSLEAALQELYSRPKT